MLIHHLSIILKLTKLVFKAIGIYIRGRFYQTLLIGLKLMFMALIIKIPGLDRMTWKLILLKMSIILF